MEGLFILFALILISLIGPFRGFAFCICGRRHKKTKSTKMLIDNISENPLEWRDDGTYFYNKDKGIVFWVHCGRMQFHDTATVHTCHKKLQAVQDITVPAEPRMAYI